MKLKFHPEVKNDINNLESCLSNIERRRSNGLVCG
jgi:hypothetical protein